MVNRFSSKKRKGQFALEFIVLMAVMFLIFVGISASVTNRYLETKELERKALAQAVGDRAFDEIIMASTVVDGFQRSFTLPYRIHGSPYNITIIDNRELVVYYIDQEYVLFLPDNVNGSIIAGRNSIAKHGNVVYINS